MKRLIWLPLLFLMTVAGCAKAPSGAANHEPRSPHAPAPTAPTTDTPLRSASGKPSPGDDMPRYSEIGNGGRPIQLEAEEGRQYATQILARIRPDSFPKNMNDYLPREDFVWLRKNLRTIQRDLLAAKLTWVDSLPPRCGADSCACAFEGETKVYLEESACRDARLDKRGWAKLLTHETMHHFVGDDEGKAKALGVALAAAWYNMGHPDSPHWQIFKLADPFEHTSTAVWDGGRLLVWQDSQRVHNGNVYPAERIAMFDPLASQWRTKPFASPLPFYREAPGALSLHYSPFMLGNSLLVGTRAHGLKGFFSLAPKTMAWTFGDAAESSFCDGYPDPWLTNGKVTPVGEDYVFAYLQCRSSARSPSVDLTFAALYHHPSRAWRNVSDPTTLSHRQSPGVLAFDDKVLVFGGTRMSLRPRDEPWTVGALFDVTTKAWRPISAKGAPEPRLTPLLVWTGEEVIVFGGYGHDGTFHHQAHAYHVAEDRWRSLAPGPRLGRFRSATRHGMVDDLAAQTDQVVWTGSQALFFIGSKLVIYELFANRWTTDVAGGFPESALLNKIAWTGMEVLLWDAATHTGYRYFP